MIYLFKDVMRQMERLNGPLYEVSSPYVERYGEKHKVKQGRMKLMFISVTYWLISNSESPYWPKTRYSKCHFLKAGIFFKTRRTLYLLNTMLDQFVSVCVVISFPSKRLQKKIEVWLSTIITFLEPLSWRPAYFFLTHHTLIMIQNHTGLNNNYVH